jgi:capsular polysaccharide biosynthesis protein
VCPLDYDPWAIRLSKGELTRMVSDIDRPPATQEGAGAAARRPRPPLAAGAVVFVLLALAALAVVQRMPTAYAARAVVSVLPRPGEVSADTVRLVAQKYAVLATSPDVLSSAATAAGEPDDLDTATAATVATGTGNLDITVTLPNRDRAARAANAIADVLVTDAARDRLITGELTARAVPGGADVKPPRTLLRAAGILGSALFATVVWALLAGRAAARAVRPW